MQQISSPAFALRFSSVLFLAHSSRYRLLNCVLCSECMFALRHCPYNILDCTTHTHAIIIILKFSGKTYWKINIHENCILHVVCSCVVTCCCWCWCCCSTVCLFFVWALVCCSHVQYICLTDKYICQCNFGISLGTMLALSYAKRVKMLEFSSMSTPSLTLSQSACSRLGCRADQDQQKYRKRLMGIFRFW